MFCKDAHISREQKMKKRLGHKRRNESTVLGSTEWYCVRGGGAGGGGGGRLGIEEQQTGRRTVCFAEWNTARVKAKRNHRYTYTVRAAGNSNVGKSMRRHEAAAASSTSRHFEVMCVRCLLLESHSCPSCLSCVFSSHCSPPRSPLVPLKHTKKNN